MPNTCAFGPLRGGDVECSARHRIRASAGSALVEAVFHTSSFGAARPVSICRMLVPVTPQASLRAIRLVHTIAWAFFASCILAVPVFAWRGDFGAAFVLIAVVMVEVLVIVLNRWRCPLTGIAERYTDDRRDNFDIYLPLWLARYNKQIFGSLFAAGVFYSLFRWLGWL